MLGRDAALALWGAWFVAHRIVRDDAGTAAPVQWLALAWVAALAIERSRFTPLVVGLSLGTTTLTAPLLPALVIAWRGGWRAALRGALIAALVAAVIVVPWAAFAPRAFIDGVVLWFNDLDRFPRTKWLENHAWAAHPGLAGVFWTLHAERWMKPMQVATAGALAFVFWRRVRAARASAREEPPLGPQLVAAFLAFLLFNPVVWGYLWEPAVAMALVIAASSGLEAKDDGAPHV
jgi:hypothetical protein